MTILFGSLREQFPTSAVTITTPTTGGTIPVSSGYLFVSGKNRTNGKNLDSTGTQYNATTSSSKISIQINTSARESGEDLFEFVVGYYPTNSPTLAKQVAKWKSKDSDQETLRTLPATIEITEPGQLDTSAVATSASLPSNPLNGMNVFVTADGKYYEYDDEATSGAYPSGGGFWVETSENGQTFISSTTSAGGCDVTVPSGLSSNFIVAPPKVGDSDSTKVVFWLLNGFTEGGGPILTTGTNIDIRVEVDGVNKTSAMGGKVKVKFLGYVRRSTGILDTGIATSGTTYTWYPGILTLPEDLNRGYAAAYEIWLSYNEAEVNNIIVPGSEIFFYLTLAGSSGVQSQNADFTGNNIWTDTDRLRIFPGTRGGGRSTIENYDSFLVVAQNYSGLLDDTTSQIAAISAATNNTIVIRQNLGDLLATEDVRAFVGTASGVGQISSASNVLAVGANETLQISVTHQVSSALWTVRSDYPDRIAGTAGIATTGPPEMRVFVDKDGTLTELNNLQFLVGATPSQVINVSDISGGTVIGSLPSISTDFDVYKQETAPSITSIGGGALAAGNYTVWVAYYYPSPNGVPTTIDHKESSGCINEAAGSIADITSDLADTLNIRTTSGYTQPAIGATVVVPMSKVDLLLVGQNIHIEDGGDYEITNISLLDVTVENIGGSNAVPTTVIATDRQVTFSGQRGQQGDKGVGAGFPYTFDPTITMADPGSGNVRLNNATLSSVTAIAISNNTADTGNPDISGFIATWDDSSSTNKGQFQIGNNLTPENFGTYQITSIVDNTTWYQINVSHDSSNGTLSGTTQINFSRTGDKGDIGLTGIPGANAGYEYLFDTATTMADPGTGNLRLNNATLSNVTASAISVNTALTGNPSIASFIATWDDSTSTVKGYYQLIDQSAPENFALYTISAITDNTTWYQITISHVASNGTLSDEIQVTFIRTGDKGDTGATGQSAFTTTTANFTQPVVDSTVVISVTNSDWLSVGAYVFINDGTDSSEYEVTVIGGPTSITGRNTGLSGNTNSGNTVDSGATVIATGRGQNEGAFGLDFQSWDTSGTFSEGLDIGTWTP